VVGRTFHVKKSEAPAWESLEEGQVYLSGEFEAVGEPETEKFRINPGQTKIMRIDNLKLIKEGLRALYSDVMGRD
jgi:ATP sulfurylase